MGILKNLHLRFIIESGNNNRLRIKQLPDFFANQVVNGLHIHFLYQCFLYTVDYRKFFSLLYKFGRTFGQQFFKFCNTKSIFNHNYL